MLYAITRFDWTLRVAQGDKEAGQDDEKGDVRSDARNKNNGWGKPQPLKFNSKNIQE